MCSRPDMRAKAMPVRSARTAWSFLFISIHSRPPCRNRPHVCGGQSLIRVADAETAISRELPSLFRTREHAQPYPPCVRSRSRPRGKPAQLRCSHVLLLIVAAMQHLNDPWTRPASSTRTLLARLWSRLRRLFRSRITLFQQSRASKVVVPAANSDFDPTRLWNIGSGGCESRVYAPVVDGFFATLRRSKAPVGQLE